MPRIDADSTERSPEKGAPASRLTPDVRLLSEWTSTRLRFCNASAVNAVMAMGTFCTFSLRFSAVTTISCSTSSAKAADPISVNATAAAAEPASRQRRAFDGSIFPCSGLLDIPIPPMIARFKSRGWCASSCLLSTTAPYRPLQLFKKTRRIRSRLGPHLCRCIHHRRPADSIESEHLFVPQGSALQSGQAEKDQDGTPALS